MAAMRVFQEVQAYYRNPVTLNHTQRVTRLYRQSLRVLDSWAVNREIFNTKATELRARFNENKALSAESGLAKRLLREGEDELKSWTHPDLYVQPYMPGGSKFMRNPPLPLEAVYPDGVPPELAIASKDVNGIQVPMSAYPKGMPTVLVDMMKKTAE